MPRVTDPGQAQLHGVATQAQHVHHLTVSHLEQVLCRPLANGAVIRRDGGQTHVAVPAVNQHAGFSHVYRQIVDMRIVDTEQDCRLGVRFVHAGQKQLGIAVVLLQRTVAQTHLVRGQPFAHALDHAVVKDVGPLVKRPLRGEHHQAVKQQTPRRHAVHYPQLPRACQYLCPCLFAGVCLPRQHAGNGADGELSTGGDFGDFKPFVHFVIWLRM